MKNFEKAIRRIADAVENNTQDMLSNDDISSWDWPRNQRMAAKTFLYGVQQDDYMKAHQNPQSLANEILGDRGMEPIF